ncbi:DUF6438 domain-containing protein [Bradyrhizobium sp. CCGUVB14]|uniref:DUF6438 domain-containing protein n=1 Tax=Bradyrhizobium sp. CCGUVB14 TaxID=2949628 RepID=UPI0035C25EF0
MLVAAAVAASPPIETITYRTSPCEGSCPGYTVTVSSNGRAIYDGEYFVAIKGKRLFRVTPTEFAAFRASLAPYRPSGVKRCWSSAVPRSAPTGRSTVC